MMLVLPSAEIRYTRAGDPVAAYTFPASSAAIPQIYVEGVAYSSLNEGASSSPPAFRIATPDAVPFSRSSNLDCSHDRVPCASTVDEHTAIAQQMKRPLMAARENLSTLCNVIPRCKNPRNANGGRRFALAGRFRVTRVKTGE